MSKISKENKVGNLTLSESAGMESPSEEQQPPAQPAPEPDRTLQADAELTAVKADLEQERDRRLRLMAEYDNYRRRTQTEFQQMAFTAGARIIKALLPVLDDFDRLIHSASDETNSDSIREGVDLINKKLAAMLSAEQLEPLDAEGNPFDPELHEAVAEVEDSSLPAGTVVTEIQKGYRLAGRIIRHSKVMVSRAPAPIQEEPDVG